jgi:hypothetical protein
MVTSAIAPNHSPTVFALGALIGITGASISFWMYHDLERSKTTITRFAIVNLSVGLFLIYLDDISSAPIFVTFPGYGLVFFGWYILVEYHMVSNGQKLMFGSMMAFVGFIILAEAPFDGGWIYLKTGIIVMILGFYTLVTILGPSSS